MNTRELLAERHDHFLAAQKLIDAARSSGKDLTAVDLKDFEGHRDAIRNIDNVLARTPHNGPNPAREETVEHFMPVPPAQPAMTHDIDGRALPIFAKGQSIEQHLRSARGFNPDGEVSLGALARAMVLGGGSPAVRAALAEGTDSAGGVTVPIILSGQLIDALRARSTVFQAGAKTLMLESNKTTVAAIASDPVATWRAENAAVNVSDMTFGSVVLTPKTLAVLTTASRELWEDSLLLDQALVGSLSAAFAVELDRVALLGAGSGSEPKGVVNVAGIGSYSMGTNGAALANYDPFLEALYTLQAANAQDPTAVIMHPRSMKELNELKDSQNRPLSRPQAIADLPFLVTSKIPINDTQGSSSTASKAIMGYFPDLIVGVRAALRIEFLREKFVDNLQYGILAYLRADIAVAHAASFAKIVGIN